jgi:amino acid permease
VFGLIDYICKNISSRLFLFAKIKKYLDKKCKIFFTILIFFQSLTYVVLYGEIVVQKEFKELQKEQQE